MSKILGIIAEDLSDYAVIIALFSKYAAKSKFSTKKFVGNGCGKLKNKCDSWARQLFESGCDHVFVFHDLDLNNEAELRAILEKKIPASKFPNSLIVIPIEELEAWLLSDSAAIQSVFSLSKSPKKVSECERVVSPKEHLASIVWTLGKKRYLNTIHNEKIAQLVSLESLRRCASYQSFDTYVTTRVFTSKSKKAPRRKAG